MLRRRLLCWIVGPLTVALALPSAGATDLSTRTLVQVLDAQQVQRGMKFTQSLSTRPDLPAAARDGVADLLDGAEGHVFSVTSPSLERLPVMPSWAATRAISEVNGVRFVADRAASLTRVAIEVSQVGSPDPLMVLEATARPVAAGEWEVLAGVRGGETRAYTLPTGPVECEITCFVAAGIVAILTGVFCVLAVPTGSAVLAVVICAAAAFTIQHAADTACDRIIESCDADPSKRIYMVNIAELACQDYWSCDTRGFVTAYQYNGQMTVFFAYLEFYYSATDFAYQQYSAAEMNVRMTLDALVKKVWQWDAQLQPNVPRPYCAYFANLRVWAGFGTSGGAYSERGVPKPFSDSCPI